MQTSSESQLVKLPTIYKLTSNEKIQEWTIFVNGNSYYTESGQKGGKSTRSKPSICAGKNSSKANATTADAQALKEATAKRQLKLQGEYKETEDECTGDVGYVKPMLAKDWNDYKTDVEFPVYSDRKYNGMRCVTTAKGMFSRNGKVVVAAPHIYTALRPLFVAHPALVLDGELYNHTLRHKLNRIIELVRQAKPTEEDLKKSAEMVEYHIYDGYGFTDESSVVIPASNFNIRKTRLKHLLHQIEDKRIVLVKSDKAMDENELADYYTKYLAEEYEGQMVRLNGPYENKRSKNLLKRKEFIDKEFEIEYLIEGEGNRAGTAGAAVCKLPKACYDRDGNLFETFKSNIKGDWDWIADLWNRREEVKGKMGTIKFFAYSEYGVPLFPYLIAIRDYE